MLICRHNSTNVCWPDHVLIFPLQLPLLRCWLLLLLMLINFQCYYFHLCGHNCTAKCLLYLCYCYHIAILFLIYPIVLLNCYPIAYLLLFYSCPIAQLIMRPVNKSMKCGLYITRVYKEMCS